MSIIAPPSASKDRPVKNSKSFLTDALVSDLRELVETDDGRQITAAQAMANRLRDIAIYAQSNADAISAQKLIYERVLGKAAVIKEEETVTIPKVVFSLTEESLEKVNDSASKIIEESGVEDDGSGLVVAEIDGKVFVG